jgi:hypothetical protein
MSKHIYLVKSEDLFEFRLYSISSRIQIKEGCGEVKTWTRVKSGEDLARV